MPKKEYVGTSNCEECKKLVGELVFERRGRLLCRRCVDKIDGRIREEPKDEDE